MNEIYLTKIYWYNSNYNNGDEENKQNIKGKNGHNIVGFLFSLQQFHSWFSIYYSYIYMCSTLILGEEKAKKEKKNTTTTTYCSTNTKSKMNISYKSTNKRIHHN
ncbi:hypothetical protein FRACYDRAFT_271667 [Fragilariopsis cylindrus CCMP1102]|uniref:Uncharacterized protein n=1 Tax=Fragilariopsis cylindrus CCMP1102 TaxID=635003 RepID=A0A1E7ES48_9STRA|nr:hypothetical protein FRACYDRAFT_271667 [Fragilariopsis cylindrus CCMP1102]|eukprot:OEU08676.1 hypothetical protein FRACYDRAFT_271667 [Fragilariopsis cylindrus CCMP1102]